MQLRYSDGSWPEQADVTLTATRPDASIGSLLSTSRLQVPTTLAGDTIPARQATLMAAEQNAGAPAINYNEVGYPLSQDSASTEGRMEPAAVFGKPLADLLTVDGNYTFAYHATYGSGCTSTRELFSSLHIDVGIDGAHTTMTTTVTATAPDGTETGTITITPQDRFGNKVGPGRPNDLTIAGVTGTTLTGPVTDNGDGTYSVPVTIGPNTKPGLTIGQPDRRPQAVTGTPPTDLDCRRWKRWFWLMLLLAVLLLIALIIVAAT